MPFPDFVGEADAAWYDKHIAILIPSGDPVSAHDYAIRSIWAVAP